MFYLSVTELHLLTLSVIFKTNTFMTALNRNGIETKQNKYFHIGMYIEFHNMHNSTKISILTARLYKNTLNIFQWL